MFAAFTRLTLGVVLLGALVRPALAQADRKEGFADHFHHDDTTVLVVEDPLPHLKLFLNSPALRQVMGQAALRQLFGGPEGAALDPSEGWQWLNTNRRWVPQQLALGISDAGVGDLDHLVRTLSLYELLEAAIGGDQGDVKLQAEIKSLRSALAEELSQVRMPRCRVYVRFRDANDAGALLELLRMQVRDIAPGDLPPGVKFDMQGNMLKATVTLADVLRAQDVDVRDLLVEMGVVDLQDKPEEVNKAVRAVRDLKAEVTLEQVGKALLLTVGPTTEGGAAGLPADVTRLPEQVGQPNEQTVVWGRWNATRLKAAAAAWLTMHEKWQSTTTFALLKETPDFTEATIDTFRDLAIRLREVADNGSFRVWIEPEKSSLHLAMVEEPKAPSADLAGSALAKLLPADVEGFSVEMNKSLGQIASDSLLQVEERMATQSLRSEIRGRKDVAGEVEIGYYRHFRVLRDLIHRTGIDQYNPGYAILMGDKGKVRRIEASFEVQGQPVRMSGRDLPTPELAIIGTLRGSDAAGREHIEKAYAALIAGIRSTARPEALENQPLPAMDVKAVKIDLGLGVETFGFDGAALSKASGEAKLRLDADGDLRPHFFFVDRMVVLSTSPRLSKSILNARSGRAKRLMLPEEEEAALVALGRYRGELIGTMFEQLKAWYVTAISSVGGDVEEPEHVRLIAAFDSIAAVSRMMNKLEWTTVQPAGDRRHLTEGVILFEEAK